MKILKGCFDGFAGEDGAIQADNVGGILSMMGMKFKPTALREIIEEIDEDGKHYIEDFDSKFVKDLACLSLESFANLLPSFLLKKMMRL